MNEVNELKNVIKTEMDDKEDQIMLLQSNVNSTLKSIQDIVNDKIEPINQ